MTDDIKHTQHCNEVQAAAKAFEEKWPKFCRACNASGEWYSPGNYHRPPDGGPCGHCVEVGKCPRCAEPLELHEKSDGDWSLCKACGWDEEKISKGEMPREEAPEVECWCWEQTRDGHLQP